MFLGVAPQRPGQCPFASARLALSTVGEPCIMLTALKELVLHALLCLFWLFSERLRREFAFLPKRFFSKYISIAAHPYLLKKGQHDN